MRDGNAENMLLTSAATRHNEVAGGEDKGSDDVRVRTATMLR